MDNLPMLGRKDTLDFLEHLPVEDTETMQRAIRRIREEFNMDYREKIEAARKRTEERCLTLREVLTAMIPEEPLPDEWDSWDDFRPQSVFKIMLCFMSEEETWIEAYRDHVILIPWYDCKVTGFYADEKYTMNIWLDYEDYISKWKR